MFGIKKKDPAAANPAETAAASNTAEKTTSSRSSGSRSKKKNSRENTAATLKQSQAAILNKKTAFIIQEAYKTARTNIIFSVSGAVSNECKVIAVSSANPGEGKTTTTINLAITFAQTGAKVLLIDGDMRKPRIHQYLGVVKTNGLSTILSNQNFFDDVVFTSLRDGLDVLASGSIPPNPAELLSSDAMGGLLEKLKERYDYVFFDTPPITVVTDAVALSKFVDGVVLVVREGYTNHESIEHAINLLNIADAKVLGFFVNDVDPVGAGYGAYRGYGGRYGYRYRYNYRYNYKYRYNYRYANKKGYGYNYGDKTYGERVEMKESDTDMAGKKPAEEQEQQAAAPAQQEAEDTAKTFARQETADTAQTFAQSDTAADAEPNAEAGAEEKEI